jgi:GT2 family glycosyltransferase
MKSEFQLCLVIDEDILLHRYALIEILKYFRSHPEADFIYTDQDRLSHLGERHSPLFKPDWSPELLYSVNYLKPLLIKREALDRIDNFWSAFLEGKHWHVILSHAMKMKPNILHLSEILFHIRSNTKDWSYISPALADHVDWLEKHLKRRGMSHPEVLLGSNDQIRVTWSTSNSAVSIIIPTKDNLRLLKRCITSLIERTDYEKYDITIVDTGSQNPETWQYYKEIELETPVSIIQYEGEFNYSVVNNIGARASNGQYLLFLNNDVEILDSDWLDELVRWSELPEIGVVGAKLLYPNHSIQHMGVILGLGGHAGHVFLGADENEIGPYGSANWYRNFLAVTSACMMVDRDIFDQVGGFDEAYQLVFSDIDFCIRIVEIGYRVAVSPFARLIHRVGSTRLRYSPGSDLARSFSSLLPYLESGDLYYNRNLSYSDPFPKLRFGDEKNRVERVRAIVSQG